MRLPSHETGFDRANFLHPASYRDNASRRLFSFCVTHRFRSIPASFSSTADWREWRPTLQPDTFHPPTLAACGYVSTASVAEWLCGFCRMLARALDDLANRRTVFWTDISVW
jgi:hypothetical protein